ncbi:MAG: HlyD family efflux transporter periplasmic adaptor subunit [Bacteroidota bacterium]
MHYSLTNYYTLFGLLTGSMLLLSCGTDSPQTRGVEPVSEEARISATKSYAVHVVYPSTVHTPLTYTGRVLPRNAVDLKPKISGELVVSGFHLREGNTIQKGQMLAQIDDAQFSYNLKAQKSTFIATLSAVMGDISTDYPDEYAAWNAYLALLKPTGSFPDLPEMSHPSFRLFMTSRRVMDQFYAIKAQEAAHADFEIRAPFDGYVTHSTVEVGTVVNPQQVIASVVNRGRTEISIAVTYADLEFVKNGVDVQILGTQGQILGTGVVVRVGNTINERTQSIPVFVETDIQDLRPGMYVSVIARGNEIREVVEIETAWLTRTNQVYTIQEGKAKLVRVVPERFVNDRVLVSGLKAGDIIIAENVTEPIHGTIVATLNSEAEL